MDDLSNYQKKPRRSRSPDSRQSFHSIQIGEPVNAKDYRKAYKNPYGGRLPIGSKRLQKREQRKRTLLYASKFMFLGGSIGLMVIAALRFTAVDMTSIHAAIMNFYFLFFGLVVGLHQLGLQRVVDKFRFLNYHWGRCLFCMFLASMAFSNKEELFVQYIMTAYWFICALIFLVLMFLDRIHDKEQYKIDYKIIQSLTFKDEENDFEKLPFVKTFKGWITRNNQDYGMQQDQEVIDDLAQPAVGPPKHQNDQKHKKKRISKKQRQDDEVNEALNSSF